MNPVVLLSTLKGEHKTSLSLSLVTAYPTIHCGCLSAVPVMSQEYVTWKSEAPESLPSSCVSGAG